jgi:hypothetical protein
MYQVEKKIKFFYFLKGVEKEFKSLKSLVTHYSVMQGKKIDKRSKLKKNFFYYFFSFFSNF